MGRAAAGLHLPPPSLPHCVRGGESGPVNAAAACHQRPDARACFLNQAAAIGEGC